jgi:hypothetical protein
MVGQLEGKTQLVHCYCKCTVTYFIAVTYFVDEVLWLFHNAASSSDTDIR